MGRISYGIYQCTNPTCRFRFPFNSHTPFRERCPRCGAPTHLVAQVPILGEVSDPDPMPAEPVVDALLDNIRSTYNVGSIFRAADGAGIRHLHLCGITALPSHRQVGKTALGAEHSVPWTYHPNAVDAAEELRHAGAALWALERTRNSRSLFDTVATSVPSWIVLVVGNEISGSDPEILALCDRVVHIPMQGRKGSLNVATAFGIAAYALRYRLCPASGQAKRDGRYV
jgi:23S rRNA (guanosine2251-2'-O)-methyltransferase